MENHIKARMARFFALFVLLLVLAGCGGGSSSKRSPNGSLAEIIGVLQIEDLQLGIIGAASAPSTTHSSQARAVKSYSSAVGVLDDFLWEEVPREWIVGVYPGVTLDDLKAWLAPFGILPLRGIYGTDAFVVEVPERNPDPERLMQTVLQQVPQLTYAEPNLPVKALTSGGPNDYYFVQGYQWNLRRVYLPQAWEQMEAWAAYRWASSRDLVRVAIVDTGICREHEDLNSDDLWDEAASFRASGYWNPFICDFPSGHEAPHHGTQVASILAAITNNGKGMAGAFWDPSGQRRIRLISARVYDETGSAKIASVVDAINRLTDDPEPPDIMNISLGLNEPVDHPELRQAIERAYRSGILIIAAAGNKGFVTYPAAYDGVLAVGATNPNNLVPSWSGRGSTLDLVAPGDGVVVATGRSQYKYRPNELESGTSFAAPLVSGIAALLMASGAGDAQEVRDLLLFTARSVAPHFNKSHGHSIEYGWGLVHAAAALRLGAAPEVFLARETDAGLLRVGPSIELKPNGAFRVRLEPREEPLRLVGWVDVNRDRLVSTGDFFVTVPVDLRAGQSVRLTDFKAQLYNGPELPVN